MKKFYPPFLFVLLSLFFVNLHAQEEDAFSWPKELETKNKSKITLYQPQLESLNGNILEGRMAITIKAPEKEMIFGAAWFKATMSADKTTRIVTLEKMDITRTHFPDIMDTSKIDQFSKMLEEEMESWNLDMSMDRLAASLEEVENLKELSSQYNNDPPKIYFRTTPSALLLIDGEPIMKKDDKSGLEYVVNTTFFIVKDPKKSTYYIRGGNFWYSSKELLTGWENVKKVPNKIEKFAADNLEKNDDQEADEAQVNTPPALIVDTVPAELIQVDGEIDYKPVEGTNLLYVANSESDIIMDIPSQQHYVLLGGRWFYSKSLKDGDWKFQEPENLPEGFEKIPSESEMATVRASIPGTPEAQTALLEQSIPQTATIDRSTATVEVSYDGEPEFEAIEGTNMAYAKNTDKSVLLIEGKYYCVDNAVWFVADQPTGPWVVSDSRPDQIDDLPPDCPVYNVKYTYVYDSTPEVVYVGYLPGYTYSYVYSGVVIYGTGYYYRPWYRYYYYPRPVTFGFGVHWSPYRGWGFSFGFSWGWMSWRFHPHRYGYWGARGYRHGYRHGYRRGYAAGRRAGYMRGYAHGSANNARRNVYNNRQNGVARTNNNRTRNNVNSKARPSNKANNMYSDRSGNVYQRNNQGEFNRQSNRASTQQQPSTRQQPSTNNRASTQNQNRSRTQPSTQQSLNRSHHSRSSGATNHQRARSGGAMRGGGGRRR